MQKEPRLYNLTSLTKISSKQKADNSELSAFCLDIYSLKITVNLQSAD